MEESFHSSRQTQLVVTPLRNLGNTQVSVTIRLMSSNEKDDVSEDESPETCKNLDNCLGDGEKEHDPDEANQHMIVVVKSH